MLLSVVNAVALVAALWIPTGWADGVVRSVELKPDRDYGIMLGEILGVEIRVVTEPGFQLETANLPQSGSPISDSLELREIDFEDVPVQAGTLHRLRLAYQVFKGVRGLEMLTVPALPLRFQRGEQIGEAEVPAWNFSLISLIPENLPDEAVVLRPGLPPPVVANAHLHKLGLWLCVWVVLAIYAVWRRRLAASPFLRAAAALKPLVRQPAQMETWRQAARLVHEALNETAGRVLLSGQLAGFMEEHPQFRPWQAELERFFAHSDESFFASMAEFPEDCPVSRLEALCRKLAQAKKKS